jgi:4-hydroxy-3-methylbut-2-enyl diphosphate reductase
MPVYFVRNSDDLISNQKATVFNFSLLKEEEIVPSLLFAENLKLVVTSGASCPDKTVDLVIQKIMSLRGESESVETALEGRI